MDHYGDIEVEGRCWDSGEMVTRTLRLVAYAPAPPGMHRRVVHAIEETEVSRDLLAEVQGKLDYETADPRVHLYRWGWDGAADFMRAVAAPVEGTSGASSELWASVGWEFSEPHPVVAWATHEVDTADGPTRVALPVLAQGGFWLMADEWGAAQAARVHANEFVGTEPAAPDEGKSNHAEPWVRRYASSEQARRWLPELLGLDKIDGAL